jgi:epoxyqueuosine reductase
MTEAVKRQLIAYARSLRFDRVGVTSADSLDREQAFLESWLAEGRAGEMTYLERQSERRSRPAALLPSAQSVIALAMNYYVPDDGRDMKISRYARGRDYHNVIEKRLHAFVRYLQALAPGTECRTFVDTGPLLERAFARRAGLGFIGKNTMLITKGLGSWVFLASVVTTLKLPADAPDERSCGDCRLCIDACPTQAITAPYELDPRRCIAYLTIESSQPIPPDLRKAVGPWIFGCDICQDVCPHNARPSNEVLASLEPAPHTQLGLADILALRSDEEFQRTVTGTALVRAGRDGLLRNACVAAANLGRVDLLPLLRKLAEKDSSSLVREHAAWSVNELQKERVA